MLKRWLRYLPVGILLAAAVLLLAWLKQPKAFPEFAPVEQSTEFYLYTTSADRDHRLREARPDREEIAPLLELLEEGSFRLKGRSRSIVWEVEEAVFSLSFCHAEGDEWVEDANFDLCTDGMAYVRHDWFGFLHYQLTGCDMDAVETELFRLLGIS